MIEEAATTTDSKKRLQITIPRTSADRCHTLQRRVRDLLLDVTGEVGDGRDECYECVANGLGSRFGKSSNEVERGLLGWRLRLNTEAAEKGRHHRVDCIRARSLKDR